MSRFFCPTSKMAPSPKLFGAIVYIQNVQKYNWSRFIFKWLVVQITSYKSSHRKTGSIGGCLFFLMVCNASLFFCCTEASFLAFIGIVYHAFVYLSITYIYVHVGNLIWWVDLALHRLYTFIVGLLVVGMRHPLVRYSQIGMKKGCEVGFARREA